MKEFITVLHRPANDVISEYYWSPDVTLFIRSDIKPLTLGMGI